MGYLGDFVESRGDHPAVIMGDSGRVVSYRELDASSIRIANLLASHGLGFGSSVVILLENGIPMFEVAWACQRLGIRYTPLNTKLAVDEAAYIINDCGATVFITSMRFDDIALKLASLTPNIKHRYLVDGSSATYESLTDAVAEHDTTPNFSQVEGMPMMYSSGTTGRPKGVIRSQPEAQMGAVNPLAAFMGTPLRMSEETVYLNPAPLYHAAPLGWSMTVQRFGGTVVCMESFDATKCLSLIEKYKINRAQFVPTMFVRMLKLDESIRTKFDVSSLEAVVHAAAPCPIDVKRAMINWWGPIIYEFCAATEGHGVTWINSHEWLDRPGSVGKAIFGEIHICDDEFNELPTGEVGVIWFGGVPVKLEYHNDPVKTAEAHHPNGWTTVWDMGWVDDEGYLYLTDRKSHMIISGGVNIYPQESEDLLISHELVADAGVIGVPDEEMGEQVKAVVMLVDHSNATPQTEELLINYLRSKMAHYKCPKSIDFVTELPRQDNGKLYKRALRDRYWPTQGSKII